MREFCINTVDEDTGTYVVFQFWIKDAKFYTRTIANGVEQKVREISEEEYVNALEVYYGA